MDSEIKFVTDPLDKVFSRELLTTFAKLSKDAGPRKREEVFSILAGEVYRRYHDPAQVAYSQTKGLLPKDVKGALDFVSTGGPQWYNHIGDKYKLPYNYEPRVDPSRYSLYHDDVDEPSVALPLFRNNIPSSLARGKVSSMLTDAEHLESNGRNVNRSAATPEHIQTTIDGREGFDSPSRQSILRGRYFARKKIDLEAKCHALWTFSKPVLEYLPEVFRPRIRVDGRKVLLSDEDREYLTDPREMETAWWEIMYQLAQLTEAHWPEAHKLIVKYGERRHNSAVDDEEYIRETTEKDLQNAVDEIRESHKGNATLPQARQAIRSAAADTSPEGSAAREDSHQLIKTEPSEVEEHDGSSRPAHEQQKERLPPHGIGIPSPRPSAEDDAENPIRTQRTVSAARPIVVRPAPNDKHNDAVAPAILNNGGLITHGQMENATNGAQQDAINPTDRRDDVDRADIDEALREVDNANDSVSQVNGSVASMSLNGDGIRETPEGALTYNDVRTGYETLKRKHEWLGANPTAGANEHRALKKVREKYETEQWRAYADHKRVQADLRQAKMAESLANMFTRANRAHDQAMHDNPES